MFCSKCGKEIDNSAVVCPYCGCPTTNGQPQQTTQASFQNQTAQPNYQQAYQPNANNTQPMTAQQASATAQSGGLARAAIICAILFPIAGIICAIIGIVQYTDPTYKKQCIIAIPVAIIVWIISAIIMSGLI